jgi:hypothetical protein
MITSVLVAAEPMILMTTQTIITTVLVTTVSNITAIPLPKEEPFGKHTILEDPDGHLISIAQIESKSAEGFDLLGFLIDMGVDIQ